MLTALETGIGLLAGVDHHVGLELVRPGEGLVAVRTGERLLPSVDPQVVGQLLVGDEPLWAVGADVFLTGLVVGPLVLVADVLPAEGFAANSAEERSTTRRLFLTLFPQKII